jgi:prophage maintenance system killer protein
VSGTIEIYQSIEGENSVEVTFDKETVWLTQAQMVDLFEKTKQNISLHINNCFKEGELDKESTVKEYLTVQNEGNREINRKIKLYSLDVIISVGYRVKSQKGTQFRIWATQVLRNHILQGYTINQHRLQQKEQEVQVLKNGIQILSRAIEEKVVDNDWLQEFSNGLKLLDDYDHETLDSKGLSKAKAIYPNMENYQDLIKAMVSDFDSDVFGKTKDDNFSSSINQITKGMGTEDFYPTLEEKAATLLYLVVKNHSFVDGNKRIAAACFLKFLAANKLLFQANRTPIISNDTLASLTLFIASSKPEEMKTVKQLVISVLNRNRIK